MFDFLFSAFHFSVMTQIFVGFFFFLPPLGMYHILLHLKIVTNEMINLC